MLKIWQASKSSGITNSFKKPILNNLATFISAMRRTLNAPNCRLINVNTGRGDTYKSKWLISLEEKANLVAEIANETNEEQAWDFWREIVPELKQRQDLLSADREQLARLVLTLKQAPEKIRNESRDLIQLSIKYLSSEGSYINDYEPFTRILEDWPDVVSSNLYATFKDNFEKTVEEYDFGSDPQWIRDDIETMRAIGSVAGVDVSSDVDRFEEYASELESEENRIDEGFIRDDRNKKTETWCSSEEIDSMFSTLNE